MTARKNPHAVALGRRGGKVTSEAKAAAARANGAKNRPGYRIEKLPRYSPHAPQTWETFAPEGRHFADGCHSRVSFSYADAKAWTFDETEPCTDDCD